MVSRSTQAAVWRHLKIGLRIVLVLLTALLAATFALGWHRNFGSLEDAQPRVLLTLVGIVVGAWLSIILAAGLRRYRAISLIGFAFVVASQACYLTLVWTEWKPYVLLWRAWWMTLVPAVMLAHVVWLRLTAPPQRRAIVRVTVASAIVTALLALGIGLQRHLLETPPIAYLVALIACGTIGAIGSIVVWIQRRLMRTSRPMPLWQKAAWIAVAQAAIIAIAFYAGRVTAPAPTIFDAPPSPLAHLSPAELDAEVRADFDRLKVIAAGIDELSRDTDELSRTIHDAWTREGRSYYLPAEEDELKARFMTYLAYRAALLRMVATYHGFAAVPDPEARARCFLVGYGAGATVMQASHMLVERYGGDSAVRRKLNEPDPTCGLSPGEFDRIYDALLNERNTETFEELAAYFQAHRDDWRRRDVLPAEEFAWIEGRIDTSLRAVAASDLDRTQARIARLVERVKRDAYTPYYDVQSVISTLIGDTRIVSRPAFIRPEQIRAMQSQLEPGDILLERRNWYASNAFLPGFWPHVAIYIGTIEDLERLNLVRRDDIGRWTSDHPAIRDRVDAYLDHAHDGAPHTVLESVSEGVIFNSLAHSMSADYVAVLRPRLTDEHKAQAIARAFGHEGKPYDFEFDFFSADKLVCTELVYRSYEGLLRFDLVRIMGRDTLPALEIAKSFAASRDRDDRQLDFVLFLDAVPSEGIARVATEAEFCQSIHRPRGFNE